MGGKMSRTKGHSFERKIANDLKKFFPMARRQLEYQADVVCGVDIAETGRFKIQCKCKKSYASVNTIDEVECQNNDDIPLLVTKADRKPEMVVMRWKDFLELLDTLG